MFLNASSKRPWGLNWRSSHWFVTFVVGLGIATDLLVYSVIIPVMPFRLQSLGYQDVSSLSGWLLFAFSAGFILATMPVAILSENYNARRFPLIVGLVILIGSQIMLSEGKIYPLLCFARVLQGVGSAMIWVAGLALLCDSCPEQIIGQQLSIAMTGLTVGQVLGPPVGGALYSRFGFRGPVLFGLMVTVVDLLGRILVIERHEALVWGFDPAKLLDSERNDSTPPDEEKAQANGSTENGSGSPAAAGEPTQEENGKSGVVDQLIQEGQNSPSNDTLGRACKPNKPLPLGSVLVKLVKSPRAVAAFMLTFVWGFVVGIQEPAIPLQLQKIWGLQSDKVGLVFLAAVLPTAVASIVSGYLTDRIGSEWVAFVTIVLSLPWWTAMLVEGPLALFVVSYILAAFFMFGMISPITAELAAVSKSINGIGYAHVYGAFNLAYGIGTTIGPIIGGPIFDHVKRGYLVICSICTGSLFLCAIWSFFSLGPMPLAGRLKSLLVRQDTASAART